MNKKTLRKVAGIFMITGVCSFGCSETTTAKTEKDTGDRETAVIREKPPLDAPAAANKMLDTTKKLGDTLKVAQ